MNVGSEANVVGEVPAHVVRVIVDDDRIIRPIPIPAISDVVRRDAEEESTKAEATWTAPAEMPHMSTTNLTGKASMFPGVVEMIMRIVTPRIMPDPLVVGMHVWRFRMSGSVSHHRVRIAFGSRSGTSDRRRTMGRDVAATNASLVTTSRRSFVTPLLGEPDNRTDQ